MLCNKPSVIIQSAATDSASALRHTAHCGKKTLLLWITAARRIFLTSFQDFRGTRFWLQAKRWDGTKNSHSLFANKCECATFLMRRLKHYSECDGWESVFWGVKKKHPIGRRTAHPGGQIFTRSHWMLPSKRAHASLKQLFEDEQTEQLHGSFSSSLSTSSSTLTGSSPWAPKQTAEPQNCSGMRHADSCWGSVWWSPHKKNVLFFFNSTSPNTVNIPFSHSRSWRTSSPGAFKFPVTPQNAQSGWLEN